MDADALIKLSKAGAKEVVASAFTVILPPAVRQECVDQGKAGGHPDALKIEGNLKKGVLHSDDVREESSTEAIIADLGLRGGEADVLRLMLGGSADLIVADDHRFLQILDGLGVPFATPSALLIALVKAGHMAEHEALRHLEKLSEFISEQEYLEARRTLEAI